MSLIFLFLGNIFIWIAIDSYRNKESKVDLFSTKFLVQLILVLLGIFFLTAYVRMQQ